jgi:hypothetical protein
LVKSETPITRRVFRVIDEVNEGIRIWVIIANLCLRQDEASVRAVIAMVDVLRVAVAGLDILRLVILTDKTGDLLIR